MSKLDYGLEPGGSPDPTGYGEEDVRELAEERARKCICDGRVLYTIVEDSELNVWPDLAIAMRHINEDALGITVKADLLRIHALVLSKATELEMPSARRDLAIIERGRMGKTRYCDDGE